MKLILLINGSPDKILKLVGGDARVVKLDEKALSDAAAMRRIIGVNNPDEVIFGCKELGLQRFTFFMKLYIMRFALGRGMIIDETGDREVFSRAGFIFSDLPRLMIEIIASVFVIIYYHIKFPLLRIIWKKNK
jgi:hypothetical protein